MALVEHPISEIALQAALHAGVHCFVQWTDPVEKWWEAAQTVEEGRRFYSAPWLIVAAQTLIKELEMGQLRENVRHIARDAAQAKSIHPLHDLSRLELEVLSYLIRNRNRVVSSEELLREIWKCDPDEGGTNNQVRCCVKHLRRKLHERLQNAYHILTVRGQGYWLTVDESLKNPGR